MSKYFREYNIRSTLEREGFQTFGDGKLVNTIYDTFGGDNLSLDSVSSVVTAKIGDTNTFRTKLGDIKQIQSLNKVYDLEDINKELASKIGWDDFDVLNNQFFCKPSNYKMTSAHQDNAYFESDEDVVTFWIPMKPVDMINSCMFYVPGSHKDGLVHHDPIGTNIRVRTGTKGLSLYSSYYNNKDFVEVPMGRGEILVHDKNTMHFSSPNLTDEYRISFTAILKRKQ